MNVRLWVGAVVGLLLGCSSGSRGLSVSAKTSAPGGTARSSLDLGNGVVLDRVRILVKEVEIEGGPACPAPAAATPAQVTPLHDDDGDGDDDSCELEFGPFLVDLAGAELTGGIHQVFDVPVPAGTYRELEFKVNTISAHHSAGDAGLAEMHAKHASVVVNGTYQGAPFEFVTSFEAERERKGTIVIDAEAGANVTLDIDPTGWFTGPGGAVLDPSDPVNRGAIFHAIRDSIRLKLDHDHDGCDDDVDPSCDDRGDDHGGSSGPG